VLRRGCLTHDDRCYAINCLDECIRLVDTNTGEILNQFKGHKSSNYMLNAQFTPDDSYIVAPSEDGRIFIWDICAKSSQTQTSPVSQDACEQSTQVGLRGAPYVAGNNLK
jgi:WD40 repeat protein